MDQLRSRMEHQGSLDAKGFDPIKEVCIEITSIAAYAAFRHYEADQLIFHPGAPLQLGWRHTENGILVPTNRR